MLPPLSLRPAFIMLCSFAVAFYYAAVLGYRIAAAIQPRPLSRELILEILFRMAILAIYIYVSWLLLWDSDLFSSWQ